MCSTHRTSTGKKNPGRCSQGAFIAGAQHRARGLEVVQVVHRPCAHAAGRAAPAWGENGGEDTPWSEGAVGGTHD